MVYGGVSLIWFGYIFILEDVVDVVDVVDVGSQYIIYCKNELKEKVL